MVTATKLAIPEAFDLMMQLGIALGVRNICDYPGAWIQKVDELWTFAVNGRDETLRVTPSDGDMSADVPFGHAAVWYAGWLAGIIDPTGGVFLSSPSGEGASEDSFIETLQRVIAQAPGANVDQAESQS